MLVQHKSQNAIVNLQQVSYLEASNSDTQFRIDFFAVIGGGQSEHDEKRMIDPNKRKFASWAFEDKSERDNILTSLIHKTGGLVLGLDTSSYGGGDVIFA